MKSLSEIYIECSTTSPVIGGDKGTVHSYIEHYYSLNFDPIRHKAKRILEIGINNGHSLRMWKQYFTNHSQIIGVDINHFNQDIGCKIIQGDATLEQTFDGIDSLDIIVDDGSHKFKHQIKSFEILFPRLNPGGIYVIEDIENIDKRTKRFLNLAENVKIYDFRHLKNRSDDVIVEIRK